MTAQTKTAPSSITGLALIDHTGRRWSLTGEPLVIGRDRTATLILSDPGISRTHARLSSHADGWQIEDLGATNGTFVNGARVARQPLGPGDTITVGGVHLRVTTLDEPLTGATGATGALPQVLAGLAWRPVQAELMSTPPAISTNSSRRAISGEVRGFASRKEDDKGKHGWEIWTFRVEQFDARGNRLPPVPIAMRGRRFSGFVADGHHVHVKRPLGSRALLRTWRLQNFSTGMQVRAHRLTWGMMPALVAGIILSVLLVLAIAVGASQPAASGFGG